MAPKNKFTKDEMTAAALEVVRENGIGGLTAKTLAAKLGTSTQPVFTCFGSMQSVKAQVYSAAVNIFEDYINAGLEEQPPFYGVGTQYIGFARNEPELYRFLFLTELHDKNCGAMDAMRCMQKAVRPMLTHMYNITDTEADCYSSSLWLAAHSLSTLIVTGNCPYSDEQIGAILTRFSVCICKGIKGIPGFAAGDFDSGKVFTRLINGGH